MPLKDILVYLDEGNSNAERIKTALLLAGQHDAHLTGITLSHLKLKHSKVSDKKAQKNFEILAAEKRAADFTEQAKEKGVSATTRIVHGDEKHAAKRVAQVARNFDLVILRQANPKNINHSLSEEVAEQVILLSGRPIFFMPYIGGHHIPCKKAMIAWDGSATAARAVHNALPLLKMIKEVIILVIQEGKEKTAKGEALTDDLAQHLVRHDVNAIVRRVRSGTFDVTTVLLNQIAETDVDLLVMGGYGKPSLRSKVFGGVTSNILKSMLIPVIISH